MGYHYRLVFRLLCFAVLIFTVVLPCARADVISHSVLLTNVPPNLQWPLVTSAINSLFGKRRDPISRRVRFHRGIDLDGAYGAPVSAAAEGHIVEAGWYKGHGRRVVIEHAGGYVSTYSHLSRIVAVPKTRVQPGEHIGLVGNSGHSTGPHLHFEILKHGVHIDPLLVLGTGIHY